MKISHIAFATGLALSIAAAAPAQSTAGANDSKQRESSSKQRESSTESHANETPGVRKPIIKKESPSPDPTPVPPAAMVVPKAGPPSGGLGAIVNPNPFVGGSMITLALGTLAGLFLRRRRTAA